METTKQIIERIQRDLAIQESQLRKFENCLERCNYIVEVGAYTLAGDENDNAIYVLKRTPTQWTEEAANANAEEMRRLKINDHIRVVDKFTWYKEQIESKKSTLEMLEKLLEIENKAA